MEGRFSSVIQQLEDVAMEVASKRSNPPEAAAVVAEIHELKKAVADTWEHVSSLLSEAMGDDPEIMLGDVVVEKRTGAPRKAWKHDELADEVTRRIIGSSVDMDTGEVVKSQEQMMKEMLSYGAVSYWRVKNLAKIGLIADEYCEVGEPKVSIIVRQQSVIAGGEDEE
jgi:hypothetical protein